MLQTLGRGEVGRGAEISPECVPLHQTNNTALWLKRHITTLPNDVLSYIFNHLECDDIAQVNDTCQRFRRVVHERHWEALLFSQLPMLLKKQHLQSLPLQKQLVQDSLHPFITKPYTWEREVFNAEQQAAVACMHPQRRMVATARYRPVEVLSEGLICSGAQVVYTQTNRNILIYYKDLSRVYLFGRNDSGSWSRQSLDQSVHDGYCCPLSGVSFSSNERYLSVFSRSRRIQIYKFDSGSWQFNRQQRIEEGYHFEVSPSGKYLAVLTITGSINSIRCFDEAVCWQSMPMPSDNKRDAAVQWCQFSSSEQHIAIRYKKKLVILSMNCQGHWKQSWETTWSRCTENVSLRFSPSEQYVFICYVRKVVILSQDSGGSWNLLWESPTNRGVDYVEFCPSGSWLLIGFLRSVDMIGLDPAGKGISKQNLSPRNRQLTFSPGGKYLVSEEGEDHYLLWRLFKSGQWLFYGDLTDPASPWPGETALLHSITFSSCDNYLLTSTCNGVVNIWGRSEQGSWMVLCSGQHDYPVREVRFSQSGVHALTVNNESIHIWGLNDSGLWTVKGVIPATFASDVDFHPMAEHLIVFWCFRRIRMVEIRAVLESEGRREGTIF